MQHDTNPGSPCLQELVETSMLAAISGLLFLITVTLGIDGSFLFSYMLPFPIIMAALRRSSSAGWSVMWVSASLLLSTLHIPALLTHAPVQICTSSDSKLHQA